MRASIPDESLQLFDLRIDHAKTLHVRGDPKAAGQELRAARMLQPAYAQVAMDKTRAWREAKVAAKRAALGAFKICTKCKKRRRNSSFHVQRVGLYGWEYRRSVCKKCAFVMSSAWRKANPDKSEISRKRSYIKRNHANHLMKNFGLTPEQFEQLYSTSNGLCKICERPESRKNRRLSLDHDHKTGRLRGFICSKCNMLLGYVGDDPDWLERAARYLRTADLGVTLTTGRSVPRTSMNDTLTEAVSRDA